MYAEEGTVLVTGATGFIGRRLVQALLTEGYRVRCLVRQADASLPERAERAVCDVLERRGLDAALAGIDTAYYLIHSMAGGRADFEQRDRDAAANFTTAANRSGLRRVIYLGGLGETGDNLSGHLASRLEVANILKGGTFQTTFLRAAVIIGAGGASFEMVRTLVERLPLMITPRWVSTRCQPIAVADVISYLVGALQDERCTGKTFDIGGPEVLTYREMMQRFAGVEGKPLFILQAPVLTPRLSSYWVGLITPVRPSIAIPLIEGLKNEVVCRENRIREFLPFPLTPYDDAVKIALAEGKESVYN